MAHSYDIHTTNPRRMHGAHPSQTLCINQCGASGTCSTPNCNSCAANKHFSKHFDIITHKRLTKRNTDIPVSSFSHTLPMLVRVVTRVVTLKVPVSQMCWKLFLITWFSVKDTLLSRGFLQTPAWKTGAEHALVRPQECQPSNARFL